VVDPSPSEDLQSRSGRALPLGLLAGLVVVALAAPYVLPPFQTLNLSYALIFAIAILGLNILTGYSGQISLGHGAFLAIGAYVSAIAQTKMGMNFLPTIAIWRGFTWRWRHSRSRSRSLPC